MSVPVSPLIPPSFPPLVYIHLFFRSLPAFLLCRMVHLSKVLGYTHITPKQEKYLTRLYEEIIWSTQCLALCLLLTECGTLKNDHPPPRPNVFKAHSWSL